MYETLLRVLKHHGPTLAPPRVLMDMEKAMVLAVGAVLSQSQVEFCFFHLAQAVWRHAQNSGLAVLYRRNEGVRRYVKSLCALAFLPTNDVITGFEELQDRLDEEEYKEELDALYGYFEHTYIGARHRRHRRTPQFPIEKWNVRLRTAEGLPRTNNHIEQWHRAMQTHVDAPHPSMWKFSWRPST